MPPNSFITGLLGGLTSSLAATAQSRAAEDARNQAQETAVLNHLATTSDDPEVRALALSGLMEMTQGKKRGFLGLGKLKATPSFQKLMELGQRAGIMGPGAGAPPAGPAAGGGPAASAGGPPVPAMIPSGGQGNVDESGQPLVPGSPSVVDRLVGEPLAGGASAGPPAGPASAPLVSAALPPTSPTTGGPPPPPSAAVAGSGALPYLPSDSPLRTPPDDPMSLVKRDAFGTMGPTSSMAAKEAIGQMDPKARELLDRQAALEQMRARAASEAADARAKEQARRDEQNWKMRDRELDAKLDAAQRRTESTIAALAARSDSSLNAREREQRMRDERVARARLDDRIAKLNDQRGKIRGNISLIGPEKTNALNDIATGYDDAYDAYYRETGFDPRKKGDKPTLPSDLKTPAGGPPPAAAATVGGPPPAPIPGGPPAAPPPTATIPNWSAIVSAAEQQRRAGKTPREIYQQAAPHLNQLQLQALKTYLRLGS